MATLHFPLPLPESHHCGQEALASLQSPQGPGQCQSRKITHSPHSNPKMCACPRGSTTETTVESPRHGEGKITHSPHSNPKMCACPRGSTTETTVESNTSRTLEKSP